ncbi:MAG TPA: inorganic diphosphatase [Puia sp.]|nr:inorganic diphosphatase [Puia sp.]
MESKEVVIETPKGSSQKFDYDQSSHFFKLKKILPEGMCFPFDFGFIPDTKGEDGDPLDVIVISDFPSFPGCLIDCRIIGGFKAVQSENPGKKKIIRNDRFIAVPECSAFYKKIQSIKELPDEIINELEDFFINYNKIQEKEFKVIRKLNPKEALKIIKKNSTK